MRSNVQAGLCQPHLCFAFWDTKRDTLSWYSELVTLQFMYVGSWTGVTYLRYTVLISPKKDETAVCCDPASSVLVMFGVSKRLSRSISLAVYCLFLHFRFFYRLFCRSYVGSVPNHHSHPQSTCYCWSALGIATSGLVRDSRNSPRI